MVHIDLTRRDLNVLEKIKDPESDPSLLVQVDAPHPQKPNNSAPKGVPTKNPPQTKKPPTPQQPPQKKKQPQHPHTKQQQK
jgi:hypothetical protein